MRFITALLLLAFTQLLAFDITLAPYMTKANYKDASKDSSSTNGFYTKFKSPEYSIALNYETTTLDYNATTSQLKQNDYTISYSQKISNNYNINALYHKISTSGEKDFSADIYLLDTQFYKTNKFTTGISLAYSSYGSDALAKNVYQAKAYASTYFGDYKSTMGKYLIKADATIISPDGEDTNSTLNTQYTSISLTIKQYKGDFINTVSGWMGDRIYAVEDNGFTVYNLNELHSSGFYLSSRYAITRNMGVQLSYTGERFKDLDVNMNDSMQKYLLSLDYTIR